MHLIFLLILFFLIHLLFKGIGVGQAFMVYMLGTYYEAVCAIIAYYLVESFRDPLPWANCRPEWGSNCIDSTPTDRSSLEMVKGTDLTSISYKNLTNLGNFMRTGNRTISSSEWFFV